MIVAALDSTTPAGSLAVTVPGRGVVVRAGDEARGWSARLPGDLLDLLAASGLMLAQVDLFAVAAGPGSLTGLRVGLATIQGLAFATGRPVAAVSALDLLAEYGLDVSADADPRGRAFCGAWSNAMRGEVFTALYRPRDGSAPDTADPLECVVDAAVSSPAEAAATWGAAVGSNPLIAVGDVQDELIAPLRAALGPQLVAVSRPLLGDVLIRIAQRRFRQGAVMAPHAVRPLYIRVPDAVLVRERARLAASPAGPSDG